MKIFHAIILLLALTQSVIAQPKKVYSLKQILDVRVTDTNIAPKYCHGGRFKPCVCSAFVPKTVQYRPAIKECSGKAGIVLSGKYRHIFSVVVRDGENADRFPTTGINGCSPIEVSAGLNKCSAFKTQKVLSTSDSRGGATLYCLGASGYSVLFKRVVRITVKLADNPSSNNDPIERWCLAGPNKELN